ncbi:3-oxoacyl-ACP synthase III family protein [Nereida sp. MMG025]|uniref:3-oxoacyl-ACP synthase III family protein n=1 Tax=Nereida sp. MMG025 TaxID=2909981 RepID=UPI001F401A07|nr:ketoacyl-ACP synthase III [Nereida sp. MMG025]MCF6443740.1 ketoacyl-ACP synthase III [Nereida sp. MMG025]
MKTMNVTFAGSGRALPKLCVTADALDARAGLEIGYLANKTGVTSRYYCQEETQVDLAVVAAQRALHDAQIGADQIDLVLFGASVAFHSIPATAPLIMQRLGMDDAAAAAFDINSTCLSFLTALETAALRISSGLSKTALVISAEHASRALSWDDAPETAALFGDGAAAVVLRPTQGAGGIKASLMKTFPSGYSASTLRSGGTAVSHTTDPLAFEAGSQFAMNGKVLFQLTTRHFNDFFDQLLQQSGWARDDISLVVPHQASPLALQHMVRQLGLKSSRVINIAAEVGNQVAASLPFAWDVARQQGRVSSGDKVLFLGTAAGVSFGGLAMEMP